MFAQAVSSTSATTAVRTVMNRTTAPRVLDGSAADWASRGVLRDANSSALSSGMIARNDVATPLWTCAIVMPGGVRPTTLSQSQFRDSMLSERVDGATTGHR